MTSREPIRLPKGRAVSAAVLLFALAGATGAAGSAMGVADLAHTGSTARAQYRTVTPPVVTTAPDRGTQTTPVTVLGEHGTKPTTPARAPQLAVRPTRAGEVELPFTGMLVVPLLLCGVLSLALGLAVRRRQRLD